MKWWKKRNHHWRKVKLHCVGLFMRITGKTQKAGVPNANGFIYSKDVLAEAVEKFRKRAFRPLVLGAPIAEPELRDVIGTVESIEFKDGVVQVEAQVLANEDIYKKVRRYEQRWKPLAFNTCGIGINENNEIKDFDIRSYGLVPLKSFYEDWEEGEDGEEPK